MNKKLLIAVGLSALLATVTGVQAADKEAGGGKASKCAGCHGADGKGKAPNPPLVSLAEDYIVQQLKDYKSGTRVNSMMKMMTQSLSDEDMANLAAYYASLPAK